MRSCRSPTRWPSSPACSAMARTTLERIARVRALQVTLARAAEARADAQVATEQALSSRIAELAGAVAPASGGAPALAAAAHYRERLHRSAATAANRVRAAEAEATRAAAGTRAARQDQGAVEKLIERGRADALRREGRALEEAGGGRKRHGPC